MSEKNLETEKPKTDFALILEILTKSPGLRIDRITEEALSEMEQRDLLVIELDEKNELKAFGALWDSLDEGWVEIGTLWVREDFRGSNLSSIVFTKLLDKARSLGKKVFLISSSGSVAKIAKQNNFSEDSAWRADDSVWKDIYAGSREGESRKLFYLGS